MSRLPAVALLAPKGALEAGVSDAGCGLAVVPISDQERDVMKFHMSLEGIRPELWDDLIGLSELANDIYHNPKAATCFSADPSAYLAGREIAPALLDPESIEVKTVLALHDPVVRDAVAESDLETFFLELEKQGILDRISDEDLSGLARALRDSLGAISERELGGLEGDLREGTGPHDTILIPILVIVIVIVIIVLIVFTFTAHTTVHEVDVEVDVRGSSMSMLDGNTWALLLAQHLGGEEFCKDSMEELIAAQTDRIVDIAMQIEEVTDLDIDRDALRERVVDLLSRHFV
jgi:hypothetical protein